MNIREKNRVLGISLLVVILFNILLLLNILNVQALSQLEGVRFSSLTRYDAVEITPIDFKEINQLPEIQLTRIKNNLYESEVNGEKNLLVVDFPEYFDNLEKTQISEAEFLEKIENSIKLTYNPEAWVEISSYDRFDVFIEQDFYDNHTTDLEDYLDNFEERFNTLESITGWNSEKFHDNELVIYIEGTDNSCWSGYASSGEANVFLHEDFMDADHCKRPYYVDGEPYYDNPGELGDHWIYMSGAIHESLHAINPFPIFDSTWLTEGFSQYNQYNILVSHSDINQETANTYIYEGSLNHNWEAYIANDYKDYDDNPIQDSAGYDITAWMFTMLRDDYSLDWNNFYNIINNNLETLDKALELDNQKAWYNFYVDSHIIDVFGKALGMSFSEIQDIFEYDGPGGPGWGVREWRDLDWYADLVPEFESPDYDYYYANEELTYNIDVYNNGDVGLQDVSVRLYNNGDVLEEKFINVSAQSFTSVGFVFEVGEIGISNLRVVVDEDNLKIEKNDLNNQDTLDLEFIYRSDCITTYDKITGKWTTKCM